MVMEEGISRESESREKLREDGTALHNGPVDISQFVQEVERFNRMIEPFAFLLYVWDDLRRWRYPTTTVILWIMCNLGCYVLTQAAVFTVVSLLVIAIATVCLVQLHTRLFDKFLPDTSRTDTWSEEEVDEHLALQTVRDFKFSLLQMQEFVMKCNEYLRYFYSLLKWDLSRPAFMFHSQLCLFLLSLVVLPTRWLYFALFNWFFLATETVYQSIIKYGCRLHECIQGKRSLSSLFEKQAVSYNGDVKKDSAADYDAVSSTATPDDQQEFCENLETLDDDDDDEGSGDKLDQNKPGMVARLIEMKRKRQHLANECCFECNTSFSSILKRRYYCRHCGNNFCSKCCNQKVQKSLFGATAPTAQTETVLVCSSCYKVLMAEKDKQSAGKEKPV